MRTARKNRQVEVITHDSSEYAADVPSITIPIPQSPRTSRMNRLVSRRLAHKGEWNTSESVTERRSGVGLFRRAKSESGETIWHLSKLLHPQ